MAHPTFPTSHILILSSSPTPRFPICGDPISTPFLPHVRNRILFFPSSSPAAGTPSIPRFPICGDPISPTCPKSNSLFPSSSPAAGTPSTGSGRAQRRSSASSRTSRASTRSKAAKRPRSDGEERRRGADADDEDDDSFSHAHARRHACARIVTALSLAPLAAPFFLDGACPLSDFVREDASLLRRACMRIVSFEKRMRIESDGASIL